MLTKDEAKTVLARIIAENPDNVNPYNIVECGCLYSFVDGNGNTSRCLIGQFGYELGWPEPAYNDDSVEWLFGLHIAGEGEASLWSGLADEACQEYLIFVQIGADGGYNYPESTPIPWKDVVL